MSEFAEVEQYLRDVVHRIGGEESDKRIRDILKDIKRQAVACNDQAKAKLVWCYEQILAIQGNYLSAFRQMKDGSYYNAWCSLERVEIDLHFFEQHCKPESDEYKLRFIEKHTKQYQSLFPYKIFLSPEVLVLEKKCSICHKPISIRNSCGHRVGEIYDGEMCGREITKVEPLGMAFVETPVQKYSVPFLVDPETSQSHDHYNYALIRYLIERLRDPFDAWDIRWTKRRHPHSRYKHVGRNESCPCGSGKKYKSCCLRESGVLRPHCEFIFFVPPPEHLLTLEYVD